MESIVNEKLGSQTKGEITMTDEDNNAQAAQQPPKPNPDLKSLDKLVGTWQVSGGARGQIRYEWMEGGFFLIQHVDLEHNGHKNKGIEIIGHERGFGASKPSQDIKSRYYSTTGETFEYVYELAGDTLIIWGGEKGSPAYFEGKFSADGESFSGAWVWPGGGYQSSGIRISR